MPKYQKPDSWQVYLFSPCTRWWILETAGEEAVKYVGVFSTEQKPWHTINIQSMLIEWKRG